MKKQKINQELKSFPQIGQKDFLEIIENAPEVIQTASKELKDAFVALEMAERALSESSERFLFLKVVREKSLRPTLKVIPQKVSLSDMEERKQQQKRHNDKRKYI